MQNGSLQSSRRLSHVLAKITLFLSLVLGTASGLSQIAVDLRQEKDAVEYSAEEFLTSVAPSASSAVYNFYMPAAEQVASGLFTQRAIKAVTIINEGEVMISREREVEPTLPNLGRSTREDLITLETPLFAPEDVSSGEQIGMILITVDRSIVAPAFVNRMVYYFAFATAKNFLLGVLLIWIVYGALARYIVTLAERTAAWTPDIKALDVADAPALMRDTELDSLAQQIRKLARTASGRIQEAEASQVMLSKEVYQKNLKLEEANSRLKELAELDALTGLYNRRSFDRLAEEAITGPSEVSVAMIDVDFFKSYNDYYGHQAGDGCLKTVAKTVRESLENRNVIFARFGGEEFISLHIGQPAEFEAMIRELHQRIWNAELEHQRSTIADRVTVSIGLASGSISDYVALSGLISDADEALYEAKARGRNQTVASSEDLRQRVLKNRNEAMDIFKAVELRSFEPFFQPQIDASTGELIGMEALVRRRLDDGSFQVPFHFMDVACANGYLAKIDRIMLEKVSESLSAAKAAGVGIPRLSLNVPREMLSERDYVLDLIKLGEDYPTELVLELLENAIYDDLTEALAWQLDELREAGIRIEIDDFGTGHTSIVCLMKLKPSRIKIAKELVLPMDADETYAQVVESIIQMSGALGIGVLAEGVETKAASERLLALGCRAQQGYFFARPMPVEELWGFLAAPERRVSQAVR